MVGGRTNAAQPADCRACVCRRHGGPGNMRSVWPLNCHEECGDAREVGGERYECAERSADLACTEDDAAAEITPTGRMENQFHLLPHVLPDLVAAHEQPIGVVAAALALAGLCSAPQQRLAEQQVCGTSDRGQRDHHEHGGHMTAEPASHKAVPAEGCES